MFINVPVVLHNIYLVSNQSHIGNRNHPIISGAVGLDLRTMQTSLEWLHTLTLLTQVIALQFIRLINLPVKQHII